MSSILMSPAEITKASRHGRGPTRPKPGPKALMSPPRPFAFSWSRGEIAVNCPYDPARAGVAQIVLNGSFVTDIMEPNDVDCVLLLASDYPRDIGAANQLEAGLPFLEISRVDDIDFHTLVDRFFATDRQGESKGMIEVIP